MSKNYKNFYRFLNYTEYLFLLISTVTGCVSISAFSTFVGIPIGITSSAIGLKICLITAGIKKYKSVIKKNKKKHNKILSLAKSRLNTVEVVLINNMPKEFDDMKGEIKYSNDK